MRTIKLILICCTVIMANNAFASSRVCCSSDLTPAECCTSNYGVWCALKSACVPDDGYCSAVCSDHKRSYNCACAGTRISVSSPTASDQPYCCAQGETLKQCCQALGFTWVGPTANTGKCSAPDPTLCIDYVKDSSSDEFVY